MAKARAVEGWHRIVETLDGSGIPALLAEDVVFESPVVHTPQAGRAITTKYLQAALKVLNNDSFHYVEEWIGERSAVLEFACEIDGIRINGVDIIRWNEAGLITHFKVMVRPLKAINMLHQKMGETLMRAG